MLSSFSFDEKEVIYVASNKSASNMTFAIYFNDGTIGFYKFELTKYQFRELTIDMPIDKI
jgi:hypothetical protein